MSASKRNVVIIQARMDSTRLPGKVLKKLGDKTVLRHVVDRCKAIPNIHDVCCAIPEGTRSDPVAQEALASGALVCRGDEFDVLGRYYNAAIETNAHTIVRITSDCPLTDPHVSGEVLRLLLKGTFDYVANNMPASYPHGLDCEAFTFDALKNAYLTAQTAYEREHVTPWIRNSSSMKKWSLMGPGGAVSDMRWTLDFPEDFSFFEALFRVQPDLGTFFDYDSIVKLLSNHPEISKINSSHHNISRPNTPQLKPKECNL